jgi:hypothetical protein
VSPEVIAPESSLPLVAARPPQPIAHPAVTTRSAATIAVKRRQSKDVFISVPREADHIVPRRRASGTRAKAQAHATRRGARGRRYFDADHRQLARVRSRTHAPSVFRSSCRVGDAFWRARSVRLGFAACAVVALGCGGNVTGNGPADASNVFGDASKNFDAGGTLDAGQSSDVQSTAENGCNIVLATDYDQSCTVDTDCIGVAQVSECPAGACSVCVTEAISRSAMTQYMEALSRSLATRPSGGQCSCPCVTIGSVCRAGKCVPAYCGPPQADWLPACADAGGYCDYAADTDCKMGPPNACAYSDEVCCLN